MHADGTVTDKQSALMWAQCSAGQTVVHGACLGEAARLNWRSAEDFADDVNLRGDLFYSDWRLPKLTELATLAERGCARPRIDLVAFPATPPSVYWTATRRPGTADASFADASFAYGLGFGEGGVAYFAKEEANAVRLVRSAR